MSWESDLDRWLTTPPDDSEPVKYDEFDNPIYENDEFYDINGWIISEDGLEECQQSLDLGESFKCSCCEDDYCDDDTDVYYVINGDKFCKECVEESKEKAWCL